MSEVSLAKSTHLADDEPLISLSNISKAYRLFEKPADRLKHTLLWRFGKAYGRDFWALRNVSFDVHKGEVVGIVGRNGSGKSTLLQIIAGVLQPTEGEVRVRGRVSALLELGSGFNPEYSGRENIFMSGTIMGIDHVEMERRYDDIVKFADIGDFIEQPVKVYSSGMLARLAFSTAMSVDPDILIADEILSVGDMAFQEKCFNVFHKMRNQGVTILFVSHDVYTVKSFCQKAIYLKEGVQKFFGPSYSVIDRYIADLENDKAKRETAPVRQEVVEVGDSAITFTIDDVVFCDSTGQPTDTVVAGNDVSIKFHYISHNKNYGRKVVFVVNLYKADGLYVCGTTTLMDGIQPIEPGCDGWVVATFPKFQMMAGNYFWRVAIDDEYGFGVIIAVNNVCNFKVEDHLEAAGIVNLPRTWNFSISSTEKAD